MFCDLKVRRTEDTSDHPSYHLQVAAKHAVGGAGGLIVDEESYATSADLLRALQNLDLTDEAMSEATETLDHEDIRDQWIVLGRELQIPFDLLVAQGFYLEERE